MGPLTPSLHDPATAVRQPRPEMAGVKVLLGFGALRGFVHLGTNVGWVGGGSVGPYGGAEMPLVLMHRPLPDTCRLGVGTHLRQTKYQIRGANLA